MREAGSEYEKRAEFELRAWRGRGGTREGERRTDTISHTPPRRQRKQCNKKGKAAVASIARSLVEDEQSFNVELGSRIAANCNSEAQFLSELKTDTTAAWPVSRRVHVSY